MVCGQLCEAPEGDYFVTCSFDPNHIILRSRMPYHIIKCVKQHPGHNKIQCPYDATEYIDRDKYDDHIINCESSSAVRSCADEKFERAHLIATGRMCNLQPTPYFHEYAPVADEDWGGAAATELNDDNDFNEDLFNDIRPVGRGTRSRHEKKMPKKGVGRAEMLKRIFDTYNESQSSSGSGSSSSVSMDGALRGNVSVGQFEDV